VTDLATPVATRAKGLGRVMAGFFGVQLFVNIANGGAANSLVPNLIARLEPDDKVAVLGLIGAVAAVAAVVTQPLWGVLSDRTRSRLGRRVPWILAGVVGLALSILGFATVGSVVLILGAAVLVSSFYSMISGPISAIVPDRAPVSRRGLFSALGSLGIFVGGLIGVVIASQFVSTIPVGFLVLAVILLVGGVPLAFALRDRGPSDAPAPRERVSWAETLRSFFVNPRQHPDFFWAFVARLVLIVGYWSIVSFQLYILDDYIGLGLDKANELFPLTTAVLGLGIIVALVPSGLLSDRIGRRKPFVIVASFVYQAAPRAGLLQRTDAEIKRMIRDGVRPTATGEEPPHNASGQAATPAPGPREPAADPAPAPTRASCARCRRAPWSRRSCRPAG